MEDLNAMSNSDNVPQWVKDWVARHLATLRVIVDSVNQGRRADRMHAGNGRYTSDCIHANLDAIKETLGDVERFRDACKEEGVDADAIIDELGGWPDGLPTDTEMHDYTEEWYPQATA